MAESVFVIEILQALYMFSETTEDSFESVDISVVFWGKGERERGVY